ncbi:MAG: hypothetical protein E6R03_05395 [Hyphomicrobiaceae bacterium]|nr:MAG: hypothetical protein E6R03_05395 [Hyphomicrobiaceae bacterium]
MVSETTGQKDDIHDWLLRYIKRQRFMESLEWVRTQIKADVDDGFSYTKDVEKMKQLRECFQRQMEHVRQEQ